MQFRMVLVCAAAVLLFGCSVRTSERRAADTASDSDDYSSWFQAISSSDVEDFESQDDADHIAYPTEEPEPDHDTEPSSVARSGDGRGASAATTGLSDVLTTDSGVGSGSDSGVSSGSDSGVGSGSDSGVGGGSDSGVGGGSDSGVGGGSDSGVGSGSDSGVGCGSVTVTGSATLGAQFSVGVPAQYLGTFGPVRRHNIWASGSASGTADLTLTGSLTATADSWSATISVSGTAATTVGIHAHQELVGLARRWFAIGDATLSGTATFADSVTFTQNCRPPGVVVSTPGTPALTVNVTVDDVTFYGFFFPRLQGPAVTLVRGAIAQFARNFANRQLAALIQPRVFAANQAYAAKKMELLGQLVAALPPGCGCALAAN
jgi:hypothetical protein